MPFRRYVEIGRVAVVNYGPEYGKLVVISDVIDQNRALIDHPDEVRRPMNFKRLALTDFKVEIPRQAKKTVLKAALEESDVFSKFHSSVWGKKLARRKTREGLTDFERFTAARAHAKRAKEVRAKLGGGSSSKEAEAES